MMKKILAHILLYFFLCSSTAFAEVPEYHWAAESIRFLEEKEVLLRLEALDANITRYEFVHLINKTCLFTKKSERSFQDLSAADSRLPAFQTADFYGYVQGDENNCANPDNDITRGEVAVILARLYGLESDKQETSYADNAQLPKWCVPSVAALQEKACFPVMRTIHSERKTRSPLRRPTPSLQGSTRMLTATVALRAETGLKSFLLKLPLPHSFPV